MKRSSAVRSSSSLVPTCPGIGRKISRASRLKSPGQRESQGSGNSNANSMARQDPGDRRLQYSGVSAVGNDIEPVAIAPVLGHPLLIRCQANDPCFGGQPLDLDQPQLTALQIEAGHVVAEVLLADIEDLPPERPLVV